MLSYSVAAKLLLCVTGLTLAQTPSNVFPQVNNNLAVVFSGQALAPGAALPVTSVASIPQIGLQTALADPNTAQTYLMMMLDVTSTDGLNNAKRKRDEAASLAAAAPLQPTDTSHLGGNDTFLQAIIQDYTLSTSTSFNDAGAMLLQSANTGPVAWQAPNPASGTHTYMILLFEQPVSWSLPTTTQAATSARVAFDLKGFIQQADLPLPRWGSYFTVTPGGVNNAVVYTSTWTAVTTYPSGGPTQSFLAVSTFTGFSGVSGFTGIPAASSVPVVEPSIASPVAASIIVTTFLESTTYPNGGPTESFQIISTILPTGVAPAAPNSILPSVVVPIAPTYTTFTSVTTLPNGGGTETFIGVTTGFVGGAAVPSPQPTTFVATSTYPDGSLQTYLTTATFGENGFPNPNGIVPGIIYTTGFTGLTTLTTTGVMTVMTYVTYPGGRVSSGLVSAFGVTTETISGVSAVSTAVYSTTSVSTTTGLINGQFSTSVVTSVGLATQTVPAFEINAASSNNNWLLEKVALLAGGMLLAWL